MELIKNVEAGRYGLEGEVYFKLFDKYISLSIEDNNSVFALECAKYLNSLNDDMISHLCIASIKYCNGFLDAVGEPTKEFSDPIKVLKLIRPSVLIVPYPEHANEPVVHMELNCEWEPEHGMEWVIRGDKVLYVGAFNGEDPWDDFQDGAEWNYA